MVDFLHDTTETLRGSCDGQRVCLVSPLGFLQNLVNKLFARHGWAVWLIEAGNHLANLLLFGAILAVWR